jgi:hypothetical protein
VKERDKYTKRRGEIHKGNKRTKIMQEGMYIQ